jgi:glycosyltransferase involved in cell wall biosynthesis
MNILMVGDAAFVGENLKKGLEKMGHTVVHDTDIHWPDIFKLKYGRQKFDVVHIHSPNFKKLLLVLKYLRHSKLVCHWHGSDLRHPLKAFPVYNLLKKADFNLYSTLDLAWWLRKVSVDRKMLFACPIDTVLFKPNGNIKHGVVVFNGGGRSIAVHKIPHDEMPEYLNQFRTVDVHNADGLDDGLPSVIAFEAASCGCNVPELPHINRQWVLDNASIFLQTKRLLDVYRRLLGV